MQEKDTFNVRLKLLREKKDVNQQDVADYLNVQRQTYSSYETGTSMPGIENLRKLATYFGVSSDYMIGLSDKPNSVEVYSASNINGSNFVGNGSVTVGESGDISKEELEILRIYRKADVRSRTKLLNSAFEIEDELANKAKD